MAGYEPLHRLIERELDQRIQEGCDVDRGKWERLLAECDDDNLQAIGAAYDKLAALQPVIDFPYTEPNELDTIRQVRPGGVRDMEHSLGERDVFDRIHGGWIGRCCGCALGRPFGQPPYTEHPESRQRVEIRRWLEGADAWPLKGYVPATSGAERVYGLSVAAPRSTLEGIRCLEPDEVTNGALAALHAVEAAGLDFHTHDVAQAWLSQLTFGLTSHAQTQSLVNLVDSEACVRVGRAQSAMESVDWPALATRRNPYREWTGAQSRGDVYGFLAPGVPEMAAEYAWRDASLSHVRNGLYSAMFVAAAVAAAFVEPDPGRVIEIGLSEIPANCRLSAAVRAVVKWRESSPAWTDCWDRIMERFGDLAVHHAVPNVALCTMALLYGEGDFETTITIAASSGLAAAANAATVGAIVATTRGARGLPAKGVSPLRNTIRSGVLGATQTTISDCARRTAKVLESAHPSSPSA